MKLSSARYVIAIAVTIVACVGFMMKMISGEDFTKVWFIIVTFYFALKKRKGE